MKIKVYQNHWTCFVLLATVFLFFFAFSRSFLFTRNSKNSEEVEWDVESDADSAEHAEPKEFQKQTEPEPEVLPENATSLTESLARAPEEKDRTKAALELSEKLYQGYVAKRRRYRRLHPRHQNSWKNVIIWYLLLPAFNCPYGLERVGVLGDGGKWFCGFELYEKPKGNTLHQDPCVLYSFGVGSDSTLEAEFMKRTNCDIFAFDATVQNMGSGVKTNTRLRFLKLLISEGEDEGGLTLGQIMRRNNHTFIDFLKVDIEGPEFRVFNQIMDEFEFLPFGQLSIELHVDQHGKMLNEVYNWWERLEQKGLRAFKSELNYHPVLQMKQKPWAIEYSFVNIRNNRSKFNLF